MSGRLILRLAPILALIAYVSFMVGGPIVSAVHAQLAVGQGLGIAAPAAGGSVCPTSSPTSTPTASPTPSPAFVPSSQATCIASGTTLNCAIPSAAQTPGNLIFGVFAGSNPKVTSGQATIVSTGSQNGYFWHVWQAGDSATIAFNGTAAATQICLGAWSGVAAGNLDLGITNGVGAALVSGSSTSMTTNTNVTSYLNDLNIIWAGIAPGAPGTITVTPASGYTSRVSGTALFGTSFGCEIEDKLAGAAGSQAAATMTLNTSESFYTGLDSFQP